MRSILRYKYLVLSFCASVIMIGCSRSFNANVTGFSKIEVDGVKAFASLSGNGTKAAGGSSETLLYAVYDNDDIRLPEITCQLEFGEEMTEAEKQQLIEDMNVILKTRNMYDMGKYVLVEAQLGYTSSYISKGGKAEVTYAVGFIYSAIRKSDGKVFSLASKRPSYPIHMFQNLMFHPYTSLEKCVYDSKGNVYIRLSSVGDMKLIAVSEGNDCIYVDDIEVEVYYPQRILDIAIDENDNVYYYSGYIGVAGTSHTIELPEVEFLGIGQNGSKAYAVACKYKEDGKYLQVYTLAGRNADLLFESKAPDETEFMSPAYNAGEHDGDALWVSGNTVIRYDVAGGTVSISKLGNGLYDLSRENRVAFFGGYAYTFKGEGNNVVVQKMSLDGGIKDTIPLEVPSGASLSEYRFMPLEITSQQLDVRMFYHIGESGGYKTQTITRIAGSEIDFSGYKVDKVIPLKQF